MKKYKNYLTGESTPLWSAKTSIRVGFFKNEHVKNYFILVLFILPLLFGVWTFLDTPKLGYICSYGLERGHLIEGSAFFDATCYEKLQNINYNNLISGLSIVLSFTTLNVTKH